MATVLARAALLAAIAGLPVSARANMAAVAASLGKIVAAAQVTLLFRVGP